MTSNIVPRLLSRRLLNVASLTTTQVQALSKAPHVLLQANKQTAKSTELSAPKKTKSWFEKKYFEFFGGVAKKQLVTSGTLMSTYCIQGLPIRDFFEFFDLPDTYQSWFLVSELHVYLVSNRLMVNQSDEGEIIRNSMIRSMWIDCQERIKLLAEIPTGKRKKYIDGLVQEFNVSIFYLQGPHFVATQI